LNPGECYGATVQAIITQIDSRDVPDNGSTLMFSGLALTGLGLFERKRLAA